MKSYRLFVNYCLTHMIIYEHWSLGETFPLSSIRRRNLGLDLDIAFLVSLHIHSLTFWPDKSVQLKRLKDLLFPFACLKTPAYMTWRADWDIISQIGFCQFGFKHKLSTTLSYDILIFTVTQVRIFPKFKNWSFQFKIRGIF